MNDKPELAALIFALCCIGGILILVGVIVYHLLQLWGKV